MLAKLGKMSAKGKDRQVIVRVESLLKQYPNSYELIASRCRAYLNRGLPGGALPDAIELVKLNSSNAEGWHLKGRSHLALAQTDSALIAHEKALSLGNKALYHYELGRAYNQAKEPDKAKIAFNQCVRSEPDFYKAYRELGSAYSILGDSAKAHLNFNKAIELTPMDPVNWNSRGLHHWAKYDLHERAIVDYDKALLINKNYAYAFNNRGWSKWKLGDTSGALKDIRHSDRRRPNNPYVHRNFGIIKLKDGRTDEACDHFRTALDLGFKELYGNEISELIDTHCKKYIKDKPIEKPTQTEEPVKQAPKSNAPGG